MPNVKPYILKEMYHCITNVPQDCIDFRLQQKGR